MPFSTRASRRRWTSRSAAWTCAGRTQIASKIAQQVRALPGVSDVLVPQDVDYPALKIDIDRERASELGLSAKEVLDSLITALTSNGMIAPSYWIDPKTGNNYLLTVQYPENYVKDLAALGSMPLRAAHLKHPTRLDSVVHITTVPSPTEVDHYQIQRTIDVYVAPSGEDLSQLMPGAEDRGPSSICRPTR
jgi:HAE1 family hydrophobic/amphiphilic exporter-1